MELLGLNGTWTMTDLTSGARYDATVPGTVAATLIAHERMPDPYWRENEFLVQEAFDGDYAFEREFAVDASMLAHEQVLLRCDGLDTIAELSVNGVPVGGADNMHRTWRFDVTAQLHVGLNRIVVVLRSPERYLQDHPALYGSRFTVLRKASCMFGWNWGPVLPDSGIWRDISLEARDGAHLEHLVIRQEHAAGRVGLAIEAIFEASRADASLHVEVLDSDGTAVAARRGALSSEPMELDIPDPQLWWPVGYGSQPLYTVVATVRAGDGTVLDRRQHVIGLRTITLDRGAEGDGARFCFIVNGERIFFRGDNLVIDDSILARSDDARWRRLVDNSVKASVNGIRVWGGAFYPPDVFYDLCDERGILVFQDCMFASTFYPTTPEFVASCQAELRDNLVRIAHRPSIAAYCGNNEIDGVYTISGATDPQSTALRALFKGQLLGAEARAALWAQYSELFLRALPEVCARYAPDTAYVHSSPSLPEPGAATSFMDYLAGGDMHYYLPYDGNAPYQYMREIRSRFLSEVGFQSFPSIKTIREFSETADEQPFSAVMRSHQKRENGNEVIDLYLRRDYPVPDDFEDYVLLTQWQAAEIMRYTVEHLRRDSAYCSGIILWQLNDPWPVVSCSGFDHAGRWKALQYAKRRFYAPVLVSAIDSGDHVELWVSNETRERFDGVVRWTLTTMDGTPLVDGRADVSIPGGVSETAVARDFGTELDAAGRGSTVLSYALERDGEEVGAGSVLFALSKDVAFEAPSVSVEVVDRPDRYEIVVGAERFAKSVVLDTRDGDCIFSDNWFDLAAGAQRTVTVDKRDVRGVEDVERLREVLTVRTVNDIVRDAREVAAVPSPSMR